MQKTEKKQHFSYALGYNSTDYTAIGATPTGLLPTPIAQKTENGQLRTDNLFNGNISTWASKNSATVDGTLEANPWTQQFTYDQLNRITSGTTQGGTRNYRNAYNYDANGNILSLKRYDLAGDKIDSLVYNYHNVDAGYKQITNKLRSVDELADATDREDDIEDQDTDNYQYDEIGNLIKDNAEEIEKIEWNVQGKIERIIRKTGSIKPDLAFNYDAAGKRISKTVYGKNAQGSINHTTTTYYIHDASGNTMATYNVASDAPLTLQEQSIYGSSRLGLLTLQGKQYELTDHLGNVRTVINENNTVASATDYYPFGMVAKSFSNGYRYGFNGKENDQETGTQDYGMRIYNPALAKFLSVDPISGKFPMLTPYQFASNTPIFAIDFDGLEAFFIHGTNHGPWAWTEKLIQPTSKALEFIAANNKTIDYGFNWKVKEKKDGILEPVEKGKDGAGDKYGLNNQINDEGDRTKAARLLADYVIKYRKDNNIVDEEITLIGYSHGGNVSILASELLYKELGVKVNIITVNTPSMNSTNDKENPYNSTGINELISFWTTDDKVAGGISPGSSDHPSKSQKERNLSLKTIEIKNRDVMRGSFWQHYLENVDPKEIMKAVNRGIKLRPVMDFRKVYDKRPDTKQEQEAKDSNA